MPVQLQVMPGHLLQEPPRVMQSWLPLETCAPSCARGASLPPGALPGKHVLAQSQGLTGGFTPTLGDRVPGAL